MSKAIPRYLAQDLLGKNEKDEVGLKSALMIEDRGSGHGLEETQLVVTAKQPFGIALFHHGLTRPGPGRVRDHRVGLGFFVCLFVPVIFLTVVSSLLFETWCKASFDGCCVKIAVR